MRVVVKRAEDADASQRRAASRTDAPETDFFLAVDLHLHRERNLDAAAGTRSGYRGNAVAQALVRPKSWSDAHPVGNRNAAKSSSSTSDRAIAKSAARPRSRSGWRLTSLGGVVADAHLDLVRVSSAAQ
jgi:hypothetical protein